MAVRPLPTCDLVRDAQEPKCLRCGTIGAGAELPAVAYGGYVARPDNTAAADEEERWGAEGQRPGPPVWRAGGGGGALAAAGRLAPGVAAWGGNLLA